MRRTPPHGRGGRSAAQHGQWSVAGPSNGCIRSRVPSSHPPAEPLGSAAPQRIEAFVTTQNPPRRRGLGGVTVVRLTRARASERLPGIRARKQPFNGENDPQRSVALEVRGPRRAPLTLFHVGRRLALQVGIEPYDRPTQRVGPVLDLHESMAFGRIEDGF